MSVLMMADMRNVLSSSQFVLSPSQIMSREQKLSNVCRTIVSSEHRTDSLHSGAISTALFSVDILCRIAMLGLIYTYKLSSHLINSNVQFRIMVSLYAQEGLRITEK